MLQIRAVLVLATANKNTEMFIHLTVGLSFLLCFLYFVVFDHFFKFRIVEKYFFFLLYHFLLWIFVYKRKISIIVMAKENSGKKTIKHADRIVAKTDGHSLKNMRPEQNHHNISFEDKRKNDYDPNYPTQRNNVALDQTDYYAKEYESQSCCYTGMSEYAKSDLLSYSQGPYNVEEFDVYGYSRMHVEEEINFLNGESIDAQNKGQQHHYSNNSKLHYKRIAVKICANCQTQNTPSWRRSLDKKVVLCNACGLYQRLHNKDRPFYMNFDGKTKAIKPATNTSLCYRCKKSIHPGYGYTDKFSGLCDICSFHFTAMIKNRPCNQLRHESLEQTVNTQHCDMNAYYNHDSIAPYQEIESNHFCDLQGRISANKGMRNECAEEFCYKRTKKDENDFDDFSTNKKYGFGHKYQDYYIQASENITKKNTDDFRNTKL